MYETDALFNSFDATEPESVLFSIWKLLDKYIEEFFSFFGLGSYFSGLVSLGSVNSGEKFVSFSL